MMTRAGLSSRYRAAGVRPSMTNRSQSSKRTSPWYTPVIFELSKRLSKGGVESLSPTREDMRRYRGILDALVAELEEDGVL